MYVSVLTILFVHNTGSAWLHSPRCYGHKTLRYYRRSSATVRGVEWFHLYATFQNKTRSCFMSTFSSAISSPNTTLGKAACISNMVYYSHWIHLHTNTDMSAATVWRYIAHRAWLYCVWGTYTPKVTCWRLLHLPIASGQVQCKNNESTYLSVCPTLLGVK